MTNCKWLFCIYISVFVFQYLWKPFIRIPRRCPLWISTDCLIDNDRHVPCLSANCSHRLYSYFDPLISFSVLILFVFLFLFAFLNPFYLASLSKLVFVCVFNLNLQCPSNWQWRTCYWPRSSGPTSIKLFVFQHSGTFNTVIYHYFHHFSLSTSFV